ncbi:right-handed parallel beta-helix repeat-containing protein [Aminobacter sp. BA135]|uniref:right-handed parallel beta-helix repeat-containing protein n=1 Tax=Aminobacter sp. BA135 TaxID=537596 RepID=UPI003D7A31C6
MHSRWALSASLLAICAVTSAHAEDLLAKRWGPWVETGGQFGKGRSLGEVNLFVPLVQNGDTLVFADLRGKFDNNDAVEGNFGLGIRHMLPSGWNLGAYGYYDIRRSPYGNTFHQLTLGAEALGEVFDLRANAYLPVGETERRTDLGATTAVGPWSSEAMLTGTSLAIRHQAVQTTTTSYRVEKALAGADAEIGIRLPVFEKGSGFDMRAFVGGYYFGGSDVEAISGPRARLEFTAADFADLPGVKLTAGLTFQHDDARGEQWITQARLRIPLQAASSAGREPLSYMERRMTDTVVRDVDIVSNTRNGARSRNDTLTSTEDAVNAWNGKIITSLVRVDGTTQDQAALQAALDSVGAQGIVLLNGNLTAAGAISLNDKQFLVGGGTVLKLKGATSGVAVDFTASGSSGRISGAAGDALVRMAADSTMRGISVENTSSSANSWAISGASGASLRDMAIVSAANGLKVENTANFTLQGGSITAAKGSAVAITNSTGVGISGATIVQNGASGIGIVADNVAGRIDGNTITTNGNGSGYNDTHSSARPAHGLQVTNGGGLTIANNVITINGELANGIHVTNSAGIAISGNKVTTNNYMSRGIRLIDSDGATISGNTVATNTMNESYVSLLTAAFGIWAEGSDNLSVSGNSVTTRAKGATGILLRYGANSSVSGNSVTTNGENAAAIALISATSNVISGNTLTTTNPTYSNGVSIGFYSHNAVVENNTVASAAPHGVYVSMSSGVAVRENRLVGRGNSGVLTTAGDTIITGNTP